MIFICSGVDQNALTFAADFWLLGSSRVNLLVTLRAFILHFWQSSINYYIFPARLSYKEGVHTVRSLPRQVET